MTVTACPGVWPIYEYQKGSTLKKSKPEDFKDWHDSIPQEIKDLFKPCKADPKWGYIIKLPEDGKPLKKGREYGIICLDPSSVFAGNVYFLQSKMAIYRKIFLSLFARPFQIVAKTIYHLCLIDACCIVIHGIKNQQSAKEIGIKVARSILDIIRTPIYGVAMIIVSLAGLIGAPFYPTFIHDIRATIGHLTQELTWGEEGKNSAGWTCISNITPCMKRRVNIMDLTLNEEKNRSEELHPVIVGLGKGRRLTSEHLEDVIS